jgi:hypothetical protein
VNAAGKIGYEADIKRMFRTKDINAMKNFGGFDLGKYDDVAEHAEAIFSRLEAGDMPCDEAWPEAQVTTFRRWIDEGKLA